jgi:hypothetical protein
VEHVPYVADATTILRRIRAAEAKKRTRGGHSLPTMLRSGLTAVVLLIARAASAEGPTIASDSFDYHSTGALLLDGGLIVGFPTALPTGMSRGVGAGVTFGRCPLRWGARAAWVTATESTTAWAVTHSDLRVRITGSAQRDIGRGSFGLRLGAGGTVVHESRLRNQGMRAGLTGNELSTSSFAMVPAADLEAVISLHLIGPWLLTISGGPSMAVVARDLHTSWIAELGIGWQP